MANAPAINIVNPAVDQVTVRKIGIADIRDALARGVDDFLTIPTQLVFLCIIYPIVGLVAARAAVNSDMLPLLFPLVAGISLLGPVLAVGIYELSRRREVGMPVSWVHAFSVLRAPSMFPIGIVAIILFAIFIAWVAVAKILYLLTVGVADPPTVGVFVEQILDTPAGWTMVILGNLAGFLFAALVLVLTVVSVPMLLDRNVSPFLALQTSIRAVRLNPGPMSLWGLIVAAALLLGCLPLFIGLAVVMPVLGHATWHLYRKVVV